MRTQDDGEYVRYEDYARLKAEVEKLRKGNERDMTAAYLYAAEQSKDVIARLKAEVDELTKTVNGLDEQLDRELDKSAMLCGQVMRLTKAGDALADFLGPCWAVREWHAAKADNLNQPD